MVFDYSSMGDARRSDELYGSFKQHSSKQRSSTGGDKREDTGYAAHPAIRKVSLNTESLRQMYNQTAISFEGMEYVNQLGVGTFGAVEKRRVTKPDGEVLHIAVKRLKAPTPALKEAQDATKPGEHLPLSSALRRMSTKDEEHERNTLVGRPSNAERDQMQSIMDTLSKDDQMFLAEVDIMRRVSHPNIIHYLGCGVLEENGKPYIAVAQECCDGGSLRALIDKSAATWHPSGRRLYSYGDALRWCIQVAEALQALHNSDPQIIHRDLKTENLMLTEKGRSGDIRVMDFGLAKLRTVARHGFKSTAENRTSYVMTGGTGSYLYMAPEVKLDQPYGEKVDIFSLGVIMYELFSMNLMASIVQKSGEEAEFELYANRVANGHREPMRESWAHGLQEVISKCWDQDPAQRPSAGLLVRLLHDLHDDIDAMDEANQRKVVSEGAGDKQSCCAIC